MDESRIEAAVQQGADDVARAILDALDALDGGARRSRSPTPAEPPPFPPETGLPLPAESRPQFLARVSLRPPLTVSQMTTTPACWCV